jgi:hypothetical protein
MSDYEHYLNEQDEREYFATLPDTSFNEGGVRGEASLEFDTVIYRVSFNYLDTPAAEDIGEYSYEFHYHLLFFAKYHEATVSMLKAWATQLFAYNVDFAIAQESDVQS